MWQKWKRGADWNGISIQENKTSSEWANKKNQSWVVDYWIKVMFSDESGLVEKVMLELLPEENKQISPLIHGMGLQDRWRTRGGGSHWLNSNWTGVCLDLGLFLIPWWKVLVMIRCATCHWGKSVKGFSLQGRGTSNVWWKLKEVMVHSAKLIYQILLMPQRIQSTKIVMFLLLIPHFSFPID